MVRYTRISGGPLVWSLVAVLAAMAADAAIANCGHCGSKSDTPSCAAPLAVGNGLSALTDAQAAGADAAKKAKAAIGDCAPKLVLVFDSNAVEDKAKMLAGVCSVFDASLVYGCPGYSPLTQDGNAGTVGVLAIGGKIQVTTAVSDLAGGHRACGQRIGERLKAASKAKAAGRLLILFGDCHVPADDDLVKGACSVLGTKFPAVGGASSGCVYDKGKVIQKSNLGILLSGCFKCDFSMKKDNSPEGLITSARDAFTASKGKDKAVLVLVFDCGGRRGKMGASLPKELEAMKAVAGKTPIFGFYGSGEIGHRDDKTPACGDGYHISVCALTPKCPCKTCGASR